MASGTPAEGSGEAVPGPAPTKTRKRAGGGFMDRLEDRWQKRRDQGPGGL